MTYLKQKYSWPYIIDKNFVISWTYLLLFICYLSTTTYATIFEKEELGIYILTTPIYKCMLIYAE